MITQSAYWGLRHDIGDTGLALVGPDEPLLPADAQRTLAGLLRRRATRGPRAADAAARRPSYAGRVSTELRPVVGPTALGADPRRFWHLTQALALTDFKLKFFGSVLGYIWQLARPFALFGVLYVVFTQVLKFGEDVVLFPVALLLGLVLYSFFARGDRRRRWRRCSTARTSSARSTSRGWRCRCR